LIVQCGFWRLWILFLCKSFLDAYTNPRSCVVLFSLANHIWKARVIFKVEAFVLTIVLSPY
jgi:hypothetical protein